MLLANLRSRTTKFDLVDEDQKVIIDAQLFNRLLLAALKSIVVDEVWYRRNNKDVDEAILSGKLESGQQHFVTDGYYEGRLPYYIKVDELFYLRTNPDVALAVKEGHCVDAQSHFDSGGGAREGRIPFEDFSLF